MVISCRCAVLFNSYVFLYAFLPGALLGFFLLARLGRACAAWWLVVASLVFYAWWNPACVPILLVSIGGNYLLSRLILASAERPRRQQAFLIAGIAANLGALGYFKYLTWLIGLLNFAPFFHPRAPSIVLPLGISFFTFTQLGYLIDCKQGAARDRGLLNYLLFVTFFPHLIAGPILHHRDMMPQFADAATYRLSAPNISVGMGIFALGLLKKCVIADPIGAVVPDGFSPPAGLPLFAAWQVALSYSLQLYFDFSGYSDMAIGLARMFNLRFPLNFNSPYKATSVIDYWQRWHMSLTHYLMRYLYNPIAMAVARWRLAHGRDMSRAAYRTPSGFSALVLLPILVTMGLAGIWHGAGAQFVVFGLLHGAYLSVNHAWRIVRRRSAARVVSPVTRAACVLATYLSVLIGAVFFRAPSVTSAMTMLGAMLGLHGVGPGIPVSSALASHLAWTGELLRVHGIIRLARWQDSLHLAETIGSLLVLYVIVWTFPNTQQIFQAQGPTIDPIANAPGKLRWRPSLPWAIALGLASTIGLLSVGGTGEFLYFQF
jgi:alginate O-acetyltransferase complex protein AlgI